MTLYELGLEYLAQEAVLRKRLAKLREEAKQRETPLLLRRIYYLTTEAAACKKTGEYLIHYYEEEQKCENIS